MTQALYQCGHAAARRHRQPNIHLPPNDSVLCEVLLPLRKSLDTLNGRAPASIPLPENSLPEVMDWKRVENQR